MAKYSVHAAIWANTTGEDVEADSPEEAIDKADIGCPSVCHQCSHEVEFSDVAFVYVLDENGEQVYSDEDTSDADDAKKWRALTAILVKSLETGVRPTLARAVDMVVKACEEPSNV